MKIEIHCLNPAIVTVDGFLTSEECDSIIKTYSPNLKRAETVNSKGGIKIDDRRTNSSATINQWESPKLISVAEKISNIVRLPPENSEPAQLLHYQGPQEYKPHPDAFNKSAGGLEQLAKGGQRLFTSICYLNDVEAGGATEFPKLKLAVAPKKGRLLIFSNVFPGQTEPHPQSTHAGLPVEKGEKYAMTLWWRQLAYHVPRTYPDEQGTIVEV